MSRSGGGKGERQSHRDIESHRTGPKVLVEVVLLRTPEVVLPELLVVCVCVCVRERETDRYRDAMWTRIASGIGLIYRPDLC